MNPTARSLLIAAAIGAIIVILAFLVAPHSCEGGLRLYFWFGAVAVSVLFTLPFFLRMGRSILASCGWAVAFLAFGVGVWLVGIFVANIKIICKLF